jgi:hypothetical protein
MRTTAFASVQKFSDKGVKTSFECALFMERKIFSGGYPHKRRLSALYLWKGKFSLMATPLKALEIHVR